MSWKSLIESALAMEKKKQLPTSSWGRETLLDLAMEAYREGLLTDEEFNSICGTPPPLKRTLDIETIAEDIVKEVVDDLRDRRGLRQEWDQIDMDVKTEIRATWKQIVLDALPSTK